LGSSSNPPVTYCSSSKRNPRKKFAALKQFQPGEKTSDFTCCLLLSAHTANSPQCPNQSLPSTRQTQNETSFKKKKKNVRLRKKTDPHPPQPLSTILPHFLNLPVPTRLRHKIELKPTKEAPRQRKLLSCGFFKSLALIQISNSKKCLPRNLFRFLINPLSQSKKL